MLGYGQADSLEWWNRGRAKVAALVAGVGGESSSQGSGGSRRSRGKFQVCCMQNRELGRPHFIGARWFIIRAARGGV